MYVPRVSYVCVMCVSLVCRVCVMCVSSVCRLCVMCVSCVCLVCLLTLITCAEASETKVTLMVYESLFFSSCISFGAAGRYHPVGILPHCNIFYIFQYYNLHVINIAKYIISNV